MRPPAKYQRISILIYRCIEILYYTRSLDDLDTNAQCQDVYRASSVVEKKYFFIRITCWSSSIF